MSFTDSGASYGDQDDPNNQGAIPTDTGGQTGGAPPDAGTSGAAGGAAGALAIPVAGAEAGVYAGKNLDPVKQIIQYMMKKYGLGGGGQPAPQQETQQGAIPGDTQTEPPTDTGGQTGSAPLDAGTSGADSAAAEAGAIPVAGAKAGASAATGVMKFLRGDDRMSMTTAGAINNKVNPDGSDPNEGLAGVNYALDKAGPDAAAAYLQNRVAQYNLSKSFAANALDGKNLASAVDAASKAFSKLPLTERTSFAVGPNGTVTATVSGEDGTPAAYRLTTSQFRELLVGNTGMSYSMMVKGPNEVLSKLAVQDHDENAPPDSAGVKAGPNGEVPDDLKSLGVNQAQYNLGFRLFPWVSQSAQREQFFAAQAAEHETQSNKLAIAQQEGQNKRDVARETGMGRAAVAGLQGQSRENVAGMQGQSRENVAGIQGRTKEKVEDTKQTALTKREQERTKEKYAQLTQSGNTSAQKIKAARALKVMSDGAARGDDEETINKELASQHLGLNEILGTTSQQTPTPGAKGNNNQGATQAGPQSAPAPKAGTIVAKGGTRYRFKGGDPAKPESWDVVQ